MTTLHVAAKRALRVFVTSEEVNLVNSHINRVATLLLL